MRRYDTTFIVNSQIGDDGIDTSVKEIANLITSSSGSILRENRVGNRRLAYQIARQTHGYYVSLIHESETETLPRLDRHFKLGENYLRHLTVRFDGDPFRKSITDIMMGFESEKRIRDEKSNGDSSVAKPESADAPAGSTKSAAATPVAPVAPIAPVAAVPVTQPSPTAPAVETEAESPAESPVESPAESKQGVTDDESTL